VPGGDARYAPSLPLKVGDVVIRSHRLLKTRGTVVRVGIPRSRGTQRVWVKWNHPHTLPNPSLEQSDTLDGIPNADAGGLVVFGPAIGPPPLPLE
jgi:hypothetical protein